jgi:serralysin
MASDVIVEAIGEGTDSVEVTFTAAGTYALSASVENATITNALNVNLTGSVDANVLTGGAGANLLSGAGGNDTLIGGLGKDTLDGGTGDDTAVLQGNRSDYTVTRTATEVVLTRSGQVVALRGIEQIVFDDTSLLMTDLLSGLPSAFADTIVGTAGDDSIDGLAGNDSLSGLQGNDTLIGGTGIDTLTGGADNDTYHVDVAGDVIVEAFGEGTDFVQVGLGSGTYLLSGHIENATVTSVAAVGITGNGLDNLLTGNAAANTLTGDAGNDTLNGAAGGDRLVGGLGDDKYLVDMASDVIVEAIGEGTDSVEVTFTAAGTYALSASVENATITNALNVNLTGSVDANVLTGGAGAKARAPTCSAAREATTRSSVGQATTRWMAERTRTLWCWTVTLPNTPSPGPPPRMFNWFGGETPPSCGTSRIFSLAMEHARWRTFRAARAGPSTIRWSAMRMPTRSTAAPATIP